jgi:hypothetical protein
MSKKAIWLIIILMTIGLLGSSLIQVYWFNWSMRQQETRFDASVLEALNKVEERLTGLETRVPLDVLNSLNRAPSQMIQQEITQFVEESGMMKKEIKDLEALNDSLLQSDKLISLLDSMDSWRRQSTLWELMDEQRRYHPADITERIELKKLTQFIKEELDNRGIHLPYQYGVIQRSDTNFIIINGNYVVGAIDESEASHLENPHSRSLFTSKYQVGLYRNDISGSPWLVEAPFSQ